MVTAMMAVLPADIPSMPSLRFEPFDTAATANTVTMTKNTHPRMYIHLSPAQRKRWA